MTDISIFSSLISKWVYSIDLQYGSIKIGQSRVDFCQLSICIDLYQAALSQFIKFSCKKNLQVSLTDTNICPRPSGGGKSVDDGDLITF